MPPMPASMSQTPNPPSQKSLTQNFGHSRPVQFTLTASQKGDAPQAATLIEGLPAEFVMIRRAIAP
jgi:hypothetical protein